jgi:hypothetical protein
LETWIITGTETEGLSDFEKYARHSFIPMSVGFLILGVLFVISALLDIK